MRWVSLLIWGLCPILIDMFGKAFVSTVAATALAVTAFVIPVDTVRQVMPSFPVSTGTATLDEQEPVVPSPVDMTQANIAVPWYRASLSEAERGVYDAIEKGLRNLDTEISVPESDAATVEKCFMFVLFDNADIFWVGEDYRYLSRNGRIFSVMPAYETEDKAAVRDRAVQMEQVADAVAAEANKIENLYDRLKFIYSWISDNCTYDAAAPDSQDIESFFINKVSACAGYSHALQYIANKAGIPCIYITGPAKTNGHVEHHAWNAAAIGGTTVYLDVTWGDRDGEAPTDYTWLGLTLTDMSVTHTPDYPELVPDADDPIYEYWAINGGGFDGYDADAVFSFLESDIAAGKESTSVRFSSAGAMDECHLDYTASTIRAEKLLKDFPGVFTDPEHVGVYSVYKQDGLNSVTFVWHR